MLDRVQIRLLDYSNRFVNVYLPRAATEVTLETQTGIPVSVLENVLQSVIENCCMLKFENERGSCCRS
jgi:hypothetical protein